ncbi:Hypothetical protein A7982_08141 [Minicystis rosea]|nr:Hypothetical protein A7982_08141 [Minicystis rosea]
MAVLPPGWAITHAARGVVPDEWISESAAGFHVEGRSGADVFRIWFLPRDWIGIRKPDPSRRRPNYWDGILANHEVTTITVSTERTIPEAIRAMGLSTPSIVNGGWPEDERIFQGRFDVAEAAALRLVSAHCPDRASKDEAAYSLIVLGIPAGSVFRRAALEGSGDAQSFAISALSYFPGQSSVSTITALLSDKATPDGARGYAAQAAENLASHALGPPLLTALGLAESGDTRTKIIRAITRLRHAPAAPAVLAALEATDNPHSKVDYATSLAAMRYAPAAGAIRKLAEKALAVGKYNLTKENEEDLRRRAQLALKVLTGDWGAPSGGVRFSLEGPKSAELGAPMEVMLYVENVSDEVQDFFRSISGRIFINDVPHDRRMLPTNGMTSLHPNAVWKSAENVGVFIKAPGTYRVRYENGAASSNTITVVVSRPAAKP